MGPRLAVIVSKCPRLKNMYKSNGRCLKKFKSNNKGNNREEQYEVLSIHLTQDCEHVRHRVWGTCNNTCRTMDPTRKFNGTMVPHKRSSIDWPHYATKEKTIKYPISAIHVHVHVCPVCVCTHIRYLVETEDKRKNKKQKVSTWEF